jgi:hypothetical protein
MREPTVTEMRETDLKAAFNAELAKALDGTGLEARFDHRMPWVQKPGANDGYWVSVVLQRWPGNPCHGRTAMFVSYVSEDDEPAPHIHCLNLEAFIRDPALLARLAVGAIRSDQEKRS